MPLLSFFWLLESLSVRRRKKVGISVYTSSERYRAIWSTTALFWMPYDLQFPTL